MNRFHDCPRHDHDGQKVRQLRAFSHSLDPKLPFMGSSEWPKAASGPLRLSRPAESTIRRRSFIGYMSFALGS